MGVWGGEGDGGWGGWWVVGSGGGLYHPVVHRQPSCTLSR